MKVLNQNAVSTVAGGVEFPVPKDNGPIPTYPVPGGGTIKPDGGITHPGPGGSPWIGGTISFPW